MHSWTVAVYNRLDGVLDKNRTEPVSAVQHHELLEINRSISDKQYVFIDLFIIIIFSNRLRTGSERKKTVKRIIITYGCSSAED